MIALIFILAFVIFLIISVSLFVGAMISSRSEEIDRLIEEDKLPYDLSYDILYKMHMYYWLPIDNPYAFEELPEIKYPLQSFWYHITNKY